jgi:hypothetical protein
MALRFRIVMFGSVPVPIACGEAHSLVVPFSVLPELPSAN